MFILGGSSGGNLALMAAYTNGVGFAPENKSRSYVLDIKGVSVFAPPVDLAAAAADLLGESITVESITDVDESLQVLLGTKELDINEAINRLNPAEYVTEDTPPTLIIQGGRDQTISPEHGMILHDALLAKNVKTSLVTYPEATHIEWPMERLLKDTHDFFQSCIRR